jgi:hypothetical protein
LLEIIASKFYKGALQLITGTTKLILDTVNSQDGNFTGSAQTGEITKNHQDE